MEELAAYERRFRRAGLPLFIEDYTARHDVFTRAGPVLTLVFVAEMLGAVQLDWSLGANVAAAAGGLGLLLAGFAAVNRARGRRFLQRPDDVGTPELAVFVLLPALLPLVFGGQWESALVTAAANLTLLLLIYFFVGYALFWIVRWTSARLLRQLASSFELLTRALPLLLVFANVLFLTQELWQVARTLPPSFVVLVTILLSGVALSFLLVRTPREVRELEREAGAGGPELRTRQRLNVGLVVLVGQILQIVLVSFAIGAFFLVLGALLANAEVREQFMGATGDVLVSFDLVGERVEITRELIRVSAGIGLFSAIYWAVAVLTDKGYRDEFLSDLTEEMRDTFRARAEYLRLREGSAA